MQKRHWIKKRISKMGFKVKLAIVFLSVFLCTSIIASSQDKFPIPSGNPKQLFYLQRTSNTNTIVYELNYKDGSLDEDEPVHVFWIRYNEKGQKEELNFIQRKFAYGIKSNLVSQDKYKLNFVSYKKYHMYLMKGADNKFNVYALINQKQAILYRIFVKINGGSLFSPNIEYVELKGFDPISGLEVKERLKI